MQVYSRYTLINGWHHFPGFPQQAACPFKGSERFQQKAGYSICRSKNTASKDSIQKSAASRRQAGIIRHVTGPEYFQG